MDGKLLWQKDLGDKRMRNQFGEGARRSSTATRLVIVWDHLAASRSSSRSTSATGKELWRVNRARDRHVGDATGRRRDGRRRSSRRRCARCASYDLETGQVVWESPGLTMNPDSVAGCGRRHGVPDERFSGQPAARRSAWPTRKGDIAGTRRGGVDARSRHALRAVAAALRRHPLFPENQLRHALGVRREDAARRTINCSGSTACPKVFASPVGADGPRLHPRP